MARQVVPHGRFSAGIGHVIVVVMVHLLAENTRPLAQQPMRLREMVQSWERRGLIPSEIATPLLRPDAAALTLVPTPPNQARVLRRLGYLGAAIVFAAGVLLTVGGRPGPLLLAGSLVMVAIRPIGLNHSRPSAPRHRAGPPPGARRARRT